MKKNSQRGFTLIELLVVIAIIGILASVVLASLNSARAKGADAAIKADLANIRAQAEIQYDSLGCYSNTGTACVAGSAPAAVASAACPAAASANIFGQTQMAAAISHAVGLGGFGACSSTVGGGAWATAVILKSGTAGTANSGWCVDSTGKSKAITVGGATLDQAAITAEVTGGACVE